MGYSKSCIDLIFTDQPNLVIGSSVHPSLHEQCHNQKAFGKLSVPHVKLPPINDKVNFVAIRKSIEMFHWHEHLNNLASTDDQVELLN